MLRSYAHLDAEDARRTDVDDTATVITLPDTDRVDLTTARTSGTLPACARPGCGHPGDRHGGLRGGPMCRECVCVAYEPGSL